MTHPAGQFKELTWIDLMVWTDKKTVAAGRKCYQRNQVHKVTVTGTRGLLAWVKSEELFATRVEYNDGDLSSECTCNPIEENCFHSIAVIIEYIVQLKKNYEFPVAKSNDPRFFLL